MKGKGVHNLCAFLIMFEINGLQWKIKQIKNNAPLLQRSDGTLTFGVTDLSDKTIYISDVLTGALLTKVLTHEICHACIFSYGIYINADEEERLCNFVASHGAEITDIVNRFYNYPKMKIM